MAMQISVGVSTMLLIISVAAPDAIAAGTADTVGVIQEISGKCSVLSGQGPALAAKPKQALTAGEQLRCTEGKMRVRLGCAERWITAAPDPVTVAWTKSGADCKEELLASVLRDYGEPGGRERSSGGILFSPADEHAVSPNTLLLRWQGVSGRKLRFELRQRRSSPDGQRVDAILWTSGEVDGGSGVLERDDLRKVLTDLQRQPGTEPLMMWVLGAGPIDQFTRFRLLSKGEQADLDAELASVQQLSSDAFLQQIGRAAVFKRFALYPEAAQEYETALRNEPRSRQLRERAAEVQALTGNNKRAEQLLENP